MAVTDLWIGKDKQPTARHGRGLRYRVSVAGHPTRGFRTRAEAQAWELHLRSNPPNQAARLPVGALVKQWLRARQGLAPSSLARCRASSQVVLATWEHTPVVDVTRHGVEAWIAGLSRADGEPASHSVRIKALQALAGALQIAVDTGAITRNPAAGIRLPRGQRRAPGFLDDDDVRRLVAAMDERWRPMLWLLITSGLRIGECVALDVDDVDTIRGRVRVRRSKTGTHREVPVPAFVLAQLDLTGEGPLFAGVRGGRLNSQWWRRTFLLPAAQTARVDPNLWTHDLRHTAASLMIDAGASVKTVQQALGHASAAMTLDVYAARFDRRLDEVAELLGKRFDG